MFNDITNLITQKVTRYFASGVQSSLIPDSSILHKKYDHLSNSNVDALLQWDKNDSPLIENIVRWDLDKVPLKYYVQSPIDKVDFLPEFEKLVDDVFIDWSRASLAKLRFQKTFLESSADIVICWESHTVFGRDYECGHNNLKVVGNWIERAQIFLVIYPLIDKFLTKIQRIERMKVTLLHEVGHSLGMQHSTEEKDVMFHRLTETNKISQNDMRILAEIYRDSDFHRYNY